MKYNINEIEWEIIEVGQEELISDYKKDSPKANIEGSYIYGRTYYPENKIKLSEELTEAEKKKTLKHELCHCWMWNNANHGREEYNDEDICEIVANSNNFINQIMNKYFTKEEIIINEDGITINRQVEIRKDKYPNKKDIAEKIIEHIKDYKDNINNELDENNTICHINFSIGKEDMFTNTEEIIHIQLSRRKRALVGLKYFNK